MKFHGYSTDIKTTKMEHIPEEVDKIKGIRPFLVNGLRSKYFSIAKKIIFVLRQIPWSTKKKNKKVTERSVFSSFWLTHIRDL